ncbi:MAG: uracil-DNA glycosylase, partial [Chloroflexota bacterium]|nr:uracil-DNA glycosylase [Chloroflexota bacterium]
MRAPGPSDPAPPGASQAWRRLHRDILACTRCVESGHIPVATPMFQGRPGQRLMLIGQAPGVVEMDVRRPFAARAGKELERWMVRAG